MGWLTNSAKKIKPTVAVLQCLVSPPQHQWCHLHWVFRSKFVHYSSPIHTPFPHWISLSNHQRRTHKVRIFVPQTPSCGHVLESHLGSRCCSAAIASYMFIAIWMDSEHTNPHKGWNTCFQDLWDDGSWISFQCATVLSILRLLVDISTESMVNEYLG